MKNNSQNNNYSFVFDFKEEQKFLNYKNLNHDSSKNSLNENNFTKSGKNSNFSKTIDLKDDNEHNTKENNEKENNLDKIDLIKNPLDSYHLVNCRSVTDFEKIEEIGEGTYGRVLFEYCEMDLVKMIERMKSLRKSLTLSDIKTLMIQILKAVDYMHRNYTLHRDLKLSNILLNKIGELKLADFGLARYYGVPFQKYTPKVVTLWYRPPEILLQSETYSWMTDIWAVGCIFGELLNNGSPLLPGKNEVNQFELTCDLIGYPNEKVWPEFYHLRASKKLLERVLDNKYNNIPSRFSEYSPACQDLLSSMLTWDPKKRISASQALLHDFFTEFPYPKPKNEISCLKYI